MSQDLSILRYIERAQQGEFRQQDVKFTWGRRTKFNSGILKLVQMIIKMILTTPGSDTFATQVGTIIPSLIRRGVTSSNAQTIKMDITVSLQDLERQIRDIQAAQPIPDDERLREIEIRTVEFLDTSNEWNIELSVLSEAGEGVSFDLAPFLKGQ